MFMKKTNTVTDSNSMHSIDHSKQHTNEINTNETRMRSSTKRPRAPIACFRCHHKKVRCDGVHPNCTRCLSTGVLCAYPSSRRSRTTQPANIDPFIDNLSQLEARIRQIEIDLENQQKAINSVVASLSLSNDKESILLATNDLKSSILKSELKAQDSRSILAQLRLKGEQRISKGRRAAAAAAAAAATAIPASTDVANPSRKSSNQDSTREENITSINNNRRQQSSTNFNCSIAYEESKPFQIPCIQTNPIDAKDPRACSSLYFQGMMFGNDAEFLRPYDAITSGQNMDRSIFDQGENKLGTYHDSIVLANTPPQTALVTNISMQSLSADLYDHSSLSFVESSKDMTSMVMNSMISTPSSTRSSSLASSIGFPVVVQPSNSTTSTSSNMTGISSCSPLNASDSMLAFNMEDVLFGSSTHAHQEMQAIPQNSSVWFYPTS